MTHNAPSLPLRYWLRLTRRHYCPPCGWFTFLRHSHTAHPNLDGWWLR